MTMRQEVLQNAAIGIGVTQTLENLSIITKPGCAASIWQRQTMPAFQKWIDALPSNPLPSTRRILQPQNVHTA